MRWPVMIVTPCSAGTSPEGARRRWEPGRSCCCALDERDRDRSPCRTVSRPLSLIRSRSSPATLDPSVRPSARTRWRSFCSSSRGGQDVRGSSPHRPAAGSGKEYSSARHSTPKKWFLHAPVARTSSHSSNPRSRLHPSVLMIDSRDRIVDKRMPAGASICLEGSGCSAGDFAGADLVDRTG